jgi:hypothetical protein
MGRDPPGRAAGTNHHEQLLHRYLPPYRLNDRGGRASAPPVVLRGVHQAAGLLSTPHAARWTARHGVRSCAVPAAAMGSCPPRTWKNIAIHRPTHVRPGSP